MSSVEINCGLDGELGRSLTVTSAKLVFVDPFGDPNIDHDNPDPVCFARVNFDEPMNKVITDFFEVAMLAIDKGSSAAFFNVRQVAELSLKGLIGRAYMGDKKLRFNHDLNELLVALGPGHDLFTGSDEDRDVIAAFIRKLAEIDPKGDEGRYAMTGGQALTRVGLLRR
jgi:HEPN domain-containing protein